MPRQPFSVVIITKNAATRLGACLESASFADEIVVIDSGSTDGTAELAGGRGARVLQKEWLGFGRQKQFAVAAGTHDWVLCLDADERVSEPLRASILAALAAPAAQAYAMPRCNRFMGRWLRHGEGYPDWSLRLFDRRHARWSDDPVHEKVLTEAPPARLQGDLLHDSAETLAGYLDKQNRYTTLAAAKLRPGDNTPGRPSCCCHRCCASSNSTCSAWDFLTACPDWFISSLAARTASSSMRKCRTFRRTRDECARRRRRRLHRLTRPRACAGARR